MSITVLLAISEHFKITLSELVRIAEHDFGHFSTVARAVLGPDEENPS